MGKKFVLSQQRLKTFPRIVAIVILGLIYYGIAEISRHIATTPQSVTPIWPPDGFASAAVLIFGYQILPGVLIGSFLANIWAFFNADNWYMAIASVLQVVGIAIGTTLGTGFGNYLFRQIMKRRNLFRRLNDVYKFLLLIGLIPPMINATVGVVCLCLGSKVSWSVFGTVWLTWWISNVAGICIFTPAILSWYEFYLKHLNTIQDAKQFPFSAQIQISRLNLWRVFETTTLIITVICLSLASFYEEFDLEYMLIPCLVWTVLRFGHLGATNLIVVITMIAILGTVKRFGAFGDESVYSLIGLQSFIVVMVVTTLSLIAILAEKQQAIASLQQSKIRLVNKSIQLESSKTSLNETALMLERQNLALTEAKKAAEEANRTKTEFISNMSHELRTPLNAILGLVQLLQESKNIDRQERLDIQTIYQSGKHLLNLIDDILDISKIEAGKMDLHLQDVYLFSLLQDLVEIIRVQANQKNIEFIYSFSPDLPRIVHTDNKRLRQILLNLLSNAVKFTNKGHIIFRVYFPQVDVDTTETSTNILINFEVEDSGIGISVDKLESIFLAFEQAGETHLKSLGTGLGLAISQKIAKMMGSKIVVSSQLGVGSIFQFSVKFQVPESNLSVKPNVSIIGGNSVFEQNLSQKLPLKILIAEDNIVNQKVAHRILSRLGYEADIVTNGLKVLEALNKHSYDVIFMDVQMPEMDGLEATKKIVNDPHRLHRPYIIAMTAGAMEGDREICLESGMDDYISKPVNVNLLVDALLRSQSSTHRA
ncbi:MAG: MASE1 domain-containing protein [Pseudanabaena sp. M046S1SP1A06QC]|nr:MASE1 domain-containing protein [Pseudanabaena sp. M046S1SP1A06QC]